MICRIAVAFVVFWPWFLIAVVLLVKGRQLHGLVVGIYIQASLVWVVPAVLVWVLIKIIGAVRKNRSSSV